MTSPQANTLDLVERFESPGTEFGPLPLWWWSGARVLAEIGTRGAQLNRGGS
jgi:hypothetical protein